MIKERQDGEWEVSSCLGNYPDVLMYNFGKQYFKPNRQDPFVN